MLVNCSLVIYFKIYFIVLNSEVVAFKLADIGEGIREVVIKEWYVKVNDTVNQFDKICEVQSDKASVTITSRFDGKIIKLCHKVEDTAKVGESLVELEVDDSSPASIDKVDDQDLSFQNSSTAIDPKAKEDDEFTNLNSSSNKVLTTPAVRKLAMENKINLQAIKPTGKDGRVLKEDILNYIESNKLRQSSTIDSSFKEKKEETQLIKQNVKPIAQHIVDYVHQYQYQYQSSSSSSTTTDRIVPIKGIQKAMFKTMASSLVIPHFGLSDEIDLTRLVQLREELKSLVKDENDGIRITFMPFFVKAASLALLRHPILNASIDESGNNLIYKSQHNIGIAIDTPHGLIVSNIKSCNQRSIKDIAIEMIRLQELANKNQLSNDDLSGGTFTLSNIGSIGGLFGIPGIIIFKLNSYLLLLILICFDSCQCSVITQPQVSIGAIGKIRKLPRFDKNDNIVKAHVTTIVWTADHRVIDGATMCRFNNLWKQFIENPSTMLTNLK